MTEVFVVGGETLESVQQEIVDFKGKVVSENPGSSSSKISRNENSLRDVEVEVISYRNTVSGELVAPAESVRIIWFNIH